MAVPESPFPRPFPESAEAPRPGEGDEALAALLRSVDTLAAVTEASVARASDLSRSLQHLVEAVSGMASRLDRLVRRADEGEARMERVSHALEGLSGQVAMVGHRLGAPAAEARPQLRAVGHDGGRPEPAG